VLDKADARNYIRDVISEYMDKVQASILMFVLMGIVIIITILSVRKKRPTRVEPTDLSLKQKYENALKEGDRQTILKLGRAYYSTLSKERLPLQEDSSNEQYAPKPNG
jgi:hypothetical protein